MIRRSPSHRQRPSWPEAPCRAVRKGLSPPLLPFPTTVAPRRVSHSRITQNRDAAGSHLHLLPTILAWESPGPPDVRMRLSPPTSGCDEIRSPSPRELGSDSRTPCHRICQAWLAPLQREAGTAFLTGSGSDGASHFLRFLSSNARMTQSFPIAGVVPLPAPPPMQRGSPFDRRAHPLRASAIPAAKSVHHLLRVGWALETQFAHGNSDETQ